MAERQLDEEATRVHLAEVGIARPPVFDVKQTSCAKREIIFVYKGIKV